MPGSQKPIIKLAKSNCGHFKDWALGPYFSGEDKLWQATNISGFTRFVHDSLLKKWLLEKENDLNRWLKSRVPIMKTAF